MASEWYGQWNSSWIDGVCNLVSCFAGDRGMETGDSTHSHDE